MANKASVSADIAKRRAAAKGAKTRATKDSAKAAPKKATRTRKAAKAVDADALTELTVDYEFVRLTQKKARYDAVEPKDGYGANALYLSQEVLGISKEADAPRVIRAVFTIE